MTKDLGIDQYLPCFQFSPNKLDVAVVPGFIDVSLYEVDKAKNCEDFIWKEYNTLMSLSGGFQEAEEKNIKKYKARQEALKRKSMGSKSRAEDL